MEDGNQLSLPSVATDGHDLLGIVEIDVFDTDGSPEDLRRKRAGEVLLQHREESHALFGIAIRVYDGFFHQRHELTTAEPLLRAVLLSARCRPVFRSRHHDRYSRRYAAA